MKRLATLSTLSVAVVLIGFLVSGFGNRLHGKEPSKTDNPGTETQVEIWLEGIPAPLITAGFWMSYNPTQIMVSSVKVFDDADLPGPWDHAMTKKLENPEGTGTYLVTLGNLANVDPDKNDEIKLAQVRLHCKGNCVEPITIKTILGFDTVVGDEGRVYDSELAPFSFTINTR
jgi:hypothetical protein